MKLGLKKNDQVKVIAGKDKGKTGKVLNVIREKERVIVEKINFVKRHSRASQKTGKGGIIEKEAPLHASNLMLICSKCGKTTRIGHQELDDGKRVRICRKCNEQVDA
jgi:large subunit ribosomal protein L24